MFTITVSSEQGESSLLELSPNIDYTSSLKVDEVKYDFYDLRSANPNFNVLQIEISSCSGRVKYELSEKINKAGSDKEKDTENYTIQKSDGKTTIKTIEYANKNHYLKIMIDPSISNNLCKINNNAIGCFSHDWVTYMVSYSTYKKEDMTTYEAEKGSMYITNL